MKNYKLIRSLHARGCSVGKLAQAIGCTHPQVSQILNNTPGRGHRVRPRLANLLTANELDLLGWDSDGTLIGATRVPYDTMFHVAQKKLADASELGSNYRPENPSSKWASKL